MALGDFTASKVPQLMTSVRAAWKDAQAVKEPELLYDTTVLNFINRQDTSRVSKLLDSDTGLCQGIKVVWLKSDGGTDSGIETDEFPEYQPCDIDGTEIESVSATYNGWKRVWASKKVRDRDCDNIFSKNDKVTRSMLEMMKDVTKQMVAYGIAKLHDFAGPNKYLPSIAEIPNIGSSVSGNIVKFPLGNANYYDLPPYLRRMTAYNKYDNMSWLDGGLLFKERMIADIQSGTGAGDVGRKAALERILGNITDASSTFMDDGVGYYKMFGVQKGAIATAFHNNNPSFEKEIGDNSINRVISAIPLLGVSDKNGNPIYVDFTQKTMELAVPGATNKCELWHVFHIQTHFNYFLNPVYTSGRNGVLELEADPNASKEANTIFPTFT